MADNKEGNITPPAPSHSVTGKYSVLEALGLSSKMKAHAEANGGAKVAQAHPTITLAEWDSPSDFREIPSNLPRDYVTVPSDRRATALAKSRTWFVLLIGQDSKRPPLSLRIVGDIVLGRKAEGVNPDVDLNPYEPALHGVSRTHAMIRPTPDQLLLSDLGSTNGTLLNGQKLRPGRTENLTDQSVISLGKLHLKVRIMLRPDENRR